MALAIILYMGHIDVEYNLYEQIKNDKIVHNATEVSKLDTYNRILISEGGLPDMKKLHVKELNNEVRDQLMLKNEIEEVHIASNKQNNIINKDKLSSLIDKIGDLSIQAYAYNPQYLSVKYLNKLMKEEEIKVTDYVKLAVYIEIYHRILTKYNKLMLNNLLLKKKAEKITGVKRNLKNALFTLSSVDELRNLN